MRHTTSDFQYGFSFAGQRDIGRHRSTNQDEIILCPNIGVFAVSDGMGGLREGGKAAVYVREAIPAMMSFVQKEAGTPEEAGAIFAETVRMVSDGLFNTANTEAYIGFGATFCGVWLYQNKAIFANLGDSRAYLLSKYKKTITQVTEDHNIAAIMVKNGELSKNDAARHPASSRLTRFVGMRAPARPDYFICNIAPGDRILLCSDGLYGMIDNRKLVGILRSSKSPRIICERLVGQANENGGKDNISVVYIRIVS
ncbi:MAG: protein phosphatase 2C domain-containing protein [Anaerotignum sp.]|nr:protein phosphatase 2C domain-containing protein [Anaerotignum sp.]